MQINKKNKPFLNKSILFSLSFFVLLGVVSNIASVLASQKYISEVVLGTDGLLETSDQDDGNTLYYGLIDETPQKWIVSHKNNIGVSGLTSVLLSLETSYQGEDNGENFFLQLLSDDEKSVVSDLEGTKQEDDNWLFHLSLVQDKIAFTMSALKTSQTFKKVEKTDNLERVAAITKIDTNVETQLASDDYYVAGYNNTIKLTHLSAKSVYSDATQLSAMIIDKNNNVLYYGKINDVNETTSSINFPTDLEAGTYQIVLFAQCVNGDYQTDYVSAFSSVDIVLHDTSHDSLCNDEICSHVYRDLNGDLHSLCAQGVQMLNDDGIMSLSDETNDTNLALGKIGAAYWTDDGSNANFNSQYSIATDGIKDNTDSYYDYGGQNKSCYFELDLKELSIIHSIRLYRYWNDNRTYRGTVIALSKTKDFSDPTIVYNSDTNGTLHGIKKTAFGSGEYDNTYSETVDGKEIIFPEEVEARYVRIYMQGSNKNNNNHIVELEVNGYVKPNEDPYFNQGIYFVSIPNIYRSDEHFTQTNTLTGKTVKRVDAVFSNDEGVEKVYRMIELQDGIFNTVVPPKKEDSSAYKYIRFRVYYSGEDNYESTRIKYDFTVSGDQNDQIDQDYTENSHGLGSFSLQGKTRDCFYWNDTYRNSYWSGHPSSDNKILDEKAIYIDNDSDGDYEQTLNDFVWDNNEIWISYYNQKTQQFISQKVTKHTRVDTSIYYLFDKDCGATEHTLIAISNGQLKDGGEFVNPTENSKIFYFMYNIASQDNMIILRYLDELQRIVGTYQTIGSERYIAFRDQLYGETGSLIAGESEKSSTEKLQYRLPSSKDDTTDTNWKEMVQNTDESSGADLYKLFFTKEKISTDYKYIQFRILDSNDQLKYKTNIEEIDDTYAFPCFFADVYQKNSPSYKGTDGIISGYWTSIFKGNYHGDGKQTIPIESNSTYNSEYYYGSATFYDYYSDFELQGNNLANDDTSGYSSGSSGSIFNNAISRYFQAQSKSNTYPFYFGGSGRNNTVDNQPLYRYSTTLSNESNRTSYNGWQRGHNYSYGFVDSTLRNGTMTTDGVAYPQFDESFLRGNNELNTALGYVYNNVSFPFKLNSDGYWEYDSSKSQYALRMKEDAKSGYYLDLTNIGVKASKNVSVGQNINAILPFNDLSESANDNKLNFLFGMKMNIEFVINESGTIKVKNSDGEYVDEDIIFTFIGDDDFIAYIDDKKALDIAGIHDAIYGEINFNSGDVLTRSISGDDELIVGEDYFKQANLYQEAGFDKSELSKGTHTLTIFYLERGQGSSNLKMTFNFPTSNQLDITNQVDLSSANPLFENALQYLGSFDYTVKNQATSGTSLKPEDSAGYLTNAGVMEFNNFENSDTYRGDSYASLSITNEAENEVIDDRDHVLVIENTSTATSDNNNTELSYSDMVKEITANRYWVSIDYAGDAGSIDLTDMSYLRMEVNNQSSGASSSGLPLYIRLVDSHGDILQATADQLTYSSYSNALPLNEWTSLRFDLDKLKTFGTNFDMANVKTIEFAFARGGGKLYIDNLSFRGKIIASETAGFNVNMNQISDYDSLNGDDYTTALLQPVNGAWYQLSNIASNDITSGNSLMVDESGLIALSNNQKASFIDKFREGSYLQIVQSDKSKNEIFKTNWSILENAVYEDGKGYTSGYIDDNWLALYPGQYSVVNNPNILDNSITHINEGINSNEEGVIVSDDRVVTSMSSGTLSSIYPSSNPDKVDDGNNTMVFRSYYNPDNSQKEGIHLTVAFENELISGGIILTKKLEQIDNKRDRTFTFHIHYTDVAGLNLERNTGAVTKEGIVQEVKVTVPKGQSEASVVIYGIPKNTEYTIHELNEVPSKVKVGGIYQYFYDGSGFTPKEIDKSTLTLSDDHSNASVINFKPDFENVEFQSVNGKMDEHLQEVVFTNKVIEPHGEVKITKKLSGTTFDSDQTFLFHIHYTYENNEKVIPILVMIPAGETSASVVYDNLPLGVKYEIHEVDESTLTSVEIGNCTLNGSDESNVDSNKSHTNVQIEENHPITNCGTYQKVISGMVNESRQAFIFTNHGPNSVSVLKTDGNDHPLAGATFTLYEKDTNKVIGTDVSKYYWQYEIKDNDEKYDNQSNRYTINDQSYVVYEVNNKKVYYVPLTNDEIDQWQSGTETANTVVAMTSFHNLADGHYYLKEIISPNGYTGQFEKDDIHFDSTSETNNQDIQYTAKNTVSTGVFTFKKENKEGQPLQAKFALYRLICTDSSHDHNESLIKFDDGNIVENECWKLVQEVDSSAYDGTVQFNQLNANDTYRLIETNAPKGYIQPEGQWIVQYDANVQAFTVKGSIGNPPAFSGNASATHPLILKNYTYQDMPSTGGKGWIYLIGFIMMIFATSLLYINKRKNRKGI